MIKTLFKKRLRDEIRYGNKEYTQYKFELKLLKIRNSLEKNLIKKLKLKNFQKKNFLNFFLYIEVILKFQIYLKKIKKKELFLMYLKNYFKQN